MSSITGRVAILKQRTERLRNQREEAVKKALLKQQKIAEIEKQLADARSKKNISEK